MGKYVLLLLALPVAELFVLVRLADAIGGLRVFLLVLVSGLIGLQIARQAGLHVIAQTQKAFATGSSPSDSVLNGALLLLAAVLLIIPGVITDVLAIMLLIPWSRRLIGEALFAQVRRAVAEGKLHVTQARPMDPWGTHSVRHPQDTVIDTEGETVESTETTSKDQSPPQLGS